MNRREFLTASLVPVDLFGSYSQSRPPVWPQSWTIAQQAFVESQSRMRAFVGGRGAGKSVCGSMDLLAKAMARPGGVYAVMSPTYPLMVSDTMRTFLEVAKYRGCVKSLNRSECTVALQNGAEVLFCHGSNPDAICLPNLAGCWINEAGRCHEDVLKTFAAVLRQGGVFGWLSLTLKASGKSHWTYPFTNNPRVATFVARTRDNPWLPPEYEANLRDLYGPKLAAQDLDCKFYENEVHS